MQLKSIEENKNKKKYFIAYFCHFYLICLHNLGWRKFKGTKCQWTKQGACQPWRARRNCKCEVVVLKNLTLHPAMLKVWMQIVTVWCHLKGSQYILRMLHGGTGSLKDSTVTRFTNTWLFSPIRKKRMDCKDHSTPQA